MEMPKQPLRTSPRRSLAPLAVEDDHVASCSSARLLITAAVSEEAETRARRIHAAGARRRLPFVRADARDFPIDAGMLREACAHLLDGAAGGTVFINDVEELPPLVQDVFIELLDELELARHPWMGVRLIAGTSVSLLDRVQSGTFAERLFYRLNVMHLTPPDRDRIAPA